MIFYYKNQFSILDTIISSGLIALIFLIMVFLAMSRNGSYNKPCCLKGYICKAVMNIVK